MTQLSLFQIEPPETLEPPRRTKPRRKLKRSPQLQLFAVRVKRDELIRLKWSAAETLAKLGWSCQMIGNAIGANKGHVSRMIRGHRKRGSDIRERTE